MTKITGHQVDEAQNQGEIVLQTGGVDRLRISRTGIAWSTAAVAASAVSAGAFTAGVGTASLSASSYDGIGSGTKYTISDIVAALKAANILGA